MGCKVYSRSCFNVNDQVKYQKGVNSFNSADSEESWTKAVSQQSTEEMQEDEVSSKIRHSDEMSGANEDAIKIDNIPNDKGSLQDDDNYEELVQVDGLKDATGSKTHGLEDDTRTIDVLKEMGLRLAGVQPESKTLERHFESQSISPSIPPSFRLSKGDPCLPSKVKEADKDAVMEGESYKKNSSTEAHGHDLES